MSGRYRPPKDDSDDEGCSGCVSKEQIPWFWVVTLVLLGILVLIGIIILIIAAVLYSRVDSEIRDVHAFIRDNHIKQRVLKAMDFAERIADNPIGFLFGGKLDEKTRQDYGKTADKLVQMISATHDNKLVENLTDLAKGMLTIVNRWAGNPGEPPTP